MMNIFNIGNKREGYSNVEEALNSDQFDYLSEEMKQQLIKMEVEEQNKFINDVCGTGSQKTDYTIGKLQGSYSELPWDTFRDDYILKVESGNEFANKLKQIENRFFVSKYGQKLYDHLLSKRVQYEKDIVNKIAQHYGLITASTSSSGNSSPSFNRTHAEVMDSITKQYELNGALLSFKSTNVASGVTDALSYFENEIKDLYGANATNDRKVEYRDVEISKITTWNTIFNAIYFILFVIVIIYKATHKELNLKQNALLYLFLIAFPIFIFPFIFSLLYRATTFSYNQISMKNHGPKNAFLDTNV
jgi:hypothetical protein